MIKYQNWSWLLLLIPIYLFIFLKIGNFHVLLWDESWFAIHAYEMIEQGSIFVPYFDGQPAIAGTKPPMQTWLQMMSIQLFGYNTMALRLPSALAATAVILWLFRVVKQNAGQLTAWVASLILLTTNGFVHFHAARGMEADSLLTLTLLAQAVFVWRFIKTENYWNLVLAGLSVGISFWVKGFAGFLFVPALFLGLIYFKRHLLGSILKSTHLYLGVGLAIGLSVAYMVIRNGLQPGYVDFVLEMQAGRAIADVGHDQSFWFYFDLLTHRFFGYWFAFGLAGIILPFALSVEGSEFLKFSAIVSIVFLFTISIARSKLQWYAMPAYPFLSVCAANAVAVIFRKLDKRYALIFLIVIFWLPSKAMFYKSQANRIDFYSMDNESQEEYLHRALNNGQNMDGVKVLHTHFKGALLFYKYQFNQRGEEISLQTRPTVEIGDTVLVRDQKFLSELHRNYVMDTISNYRSAYLLRVGDRSSSYERKSIENTLN